MTKEELIEDERYHTCGRCRYGDYPEDRYPCNVCIHSKDKREDMWELKEDLTSPLSERNNEVLIPFLMHKEMGVPISECQKAYEAAIDYLRKQSKWKG